MAFGLICQRFVLTQCTLISQESKSSRKFLSLLVVFLCQIKWFFRCGLSFFPLVYQMKEKQTASRSSFYNHITLWIKQTTFLSHLWILLAIFICICIVFVLCARTYTLFFIQDFFFCIIKYFIWFIFCFTCDYTHTFHVLFEKKTQRYNNNDTKHRTTECIF